MCFFQIMFSLSFSLNKMKTSCKFYWKINNTNTFNDGEDKQISKKSYEIRKEGK